MFIKIIRFALTISFVFAGKSDGKSIESEIGEETRCVAALGRTKDNNKAEDQREAIEALRRNDRLMTLKEAKKAR